MRVVVFSDLHLEAGSALGSADPEYGNTRMRDAAGVLADIHQASEGADAVIFAGDFARTPRPGPLAYAMICEALEGVPQFVAVRGNHDYTPEAWMGQAVAAALGGHAVDRPKLLRLGSLQVGVIPWSPPTRMFEARPNDPAELHKLVQDAIADIAVGLAEQVDPSLPSLLVLHWLVAGPGDLPEVMRSAEPVIDVARLEAGPWNVILAGHWHRHGQPGPRTWWIGPPLRSSFGEADLEPGWMEVRWPALDALGAVEEELGMPPMLAQVCHEPVEDRPLVTLDLTEYSGTFTQGELASPELEPQWNITATDALANFEGLPESWEGAIVKITYSCRPEQAAESARNAERIIDELHAAGALKVIGPAVTIVNPERELRSELTAEADSLTALDEWMASAEVPVDLHDDVRSLAREITGG